MSQSRRAVIAVACGGGCLLLASASSAGPFGSESSVGLATGYSSNPFLLSSRAQAAESEAFLLNLPMTYSGSETTIDLIPRLRMAESQGAEALLSNYQYLDGDWRFKDERDTFTATATWHHDSTFYNQFENGFLGGRDLRRMEATASLGWQHQLDERSDVQLAMSGDHVAYSDATAAALTNFDYAQASLQYERNLTERWQWTLDAGYGHYQVLNYGFESDSRFVQTGVNRALAEQWSLAAQIGYSYLSALQRADTPYYFPCVYNNVSSVCVTTLSVQQHYAAATPSYAVTLEHRGERLVLDLAASRAIEPTGIGALLTQDDVSIKASYPWTARWTVTATLHQMSLSDSLQRLQLGGRFYDADAGATWQMTEHWTAQMLASFNLQRLNGQQGNNVSVSINLLRQLGRVQWQ